MVFISIKDIIMGHQIPINKYNLMNLGDKFKTLAYPLERESFKSTILARHYSVQIASMSSVIEAQLKSTATQIEYTNATVKYTAIVMSTSMLFSLLYGGLDFASLFKIQYYDYVLTQIVAESVSNILEGWILAVAIDGITQRSLHIDDKGLRNESWSAGALGSVFGLPIFMLHNTITNTLANKLLTPISNTAAAVETSIATSAAVSKIYNQKFDLKEATISGVGMGAFSMVHTALTYGREPLKYNDLEDDYDNVMWGTDVEFYKEKRLEEYQQVIDNVFKNSNIRNQIHITKGNPNITSHNIFIGDKNSEHYQLAKSFPRIHNLISVHTHEIDHLNEFIRYAKYDLRPASATFLFHSSNSYRSIGHAINNKFESFIITTKPIEQTGKYIIGDYYHFTKIEDDIIENTTNKNNALGITNIEDDVIDNNNTIENTTNKNNTLRKIENLLFIHNTNYPNNKYKVTHLGKNLASGLKQLDKSYYGDSSHHIEERFNNAYSDWYYKPHKWGDQQITNSLPN